MPIKKAKKQFKRKSVDKKQDKRLKALEEIVLKTLETKTIDSYGSAAFSDTGSAWEVPFNTSQGVTDVDRVGNSVLLQRIQYNIMVDRADSHNRCRLLLVESLNGNEELAIADVLSFSNQVLYGDMVLASPYQTKTAINKRYKVHLDKMFEVGTSSMKNTLVFKGTIKYPKGGKIVNYDGSSTNPTDHRLTLMVISDSSTASHPTIKYVIRHKYKDC